MGCTCCKSSVQGAPRVSIDENSLGDDELVSLRKLRGEREAALTQFAEQCVGDVFMSAERNMDLHRGSLDSQNDYGKQDQTIIIFDWDDTLCPSSWINSVSPTCKVPPTYKGKLKTLSKRVESLVTLAEALGKVVIVTNAKRPWVEYSCKNTLPELLSWVKRTPVLYALEFVQELDGAVGPEDVDILLTQSKAKAMKSVLGEFYSRYPNQSWKNVVSIGDAYFEHDAVQQVVSARLAQNELKPCRCKTIKLLESLSLLGMISQCAIVENLMTNIVSHDGDLSIDFASHQSLLNEWYTRFGGSSPKRST